MPAFSPKGVFQEYKALLKRVSSLLLTFLVLSVVSMNLLANKELFRADWIALDCGFLISWIPFLIMDVVCKVYGGKAAARLSIVAITINLLFFLVFKLVSITPGMWGAFYDTGSIEVNEALNDAPEKVNNDPYGEGWMIKIRLTNAAELDTLMDAEAYQAIL